MNFIKFQKDILTISGNQKKLHKFGWSYEEGYYYITLTGCEIYRVPSNYMILNLGLINLAQDKVCKIFHQIEKEADVSDVTLRDFPSLDLEYDLIQPFKESEHWYDSSKFDSIATSREFKECLHFRMVKETGALIVYNEADEAIFLLLPFKRRPSNENTDNS